MQPIYRQALLANVTLRDLADSPNANDLIGAGTVAPLRPPRPPTPSTPVRPRFDIFGPEPEGAGAATGAAVGSALGRALGTTAGAVLLGAAGVGLGLTIAYFWR